MKNGKNKHLIINEAAIERIGLKIVIQAARDFAFPQSIPRVKEFISQIKKGEPMRDTMINNTLRRERKNIIKELRGEFVVMMSNNKSLEIADKLQAILDDKTGQAMVAFKKNVRSFDTGKED